MPAAAVTVGATLLANQQQRQQASQQADAQMRAAETQAAADAEARRDAQFRPVGTTTRFGSSNFTFGGDGKLTGGGYTLSPELLAQQSQLMGMTPGLLAQYQQAIGASAPMGAAGQRMMGLGAQYLATDPAAQAQKYMTDMQAAVSAPRAQQYAKMKEQLNATGRTGLAIGGDAGMMAANPEMAAYYNSIAQQDRDFATQAVQGGMDYAKFGSGLIGSGGDMTKAMYGVQNTAYSPYATALGGAQQLEGMGAQSFDMGMQMGKNSQTAYTPSTAMSTGMNNAARTMGGVPQMNWGGMMQGAADKWGEYSRGRQQPTYDPTASYYQGTGGSDSAWGM